MTYCDGPDRTLFKYSGNGSECKEKTKFGAILQVLRTGVNP